MQSWVGLLRPQILVDLFCRHLNLVLKPVMQKRAFVAVRRIQGRRQHKELSEEQPNGIVTVIVGGAAGSGKTFSVTDCMLSSMKL